MEFVAADDEYNNDVGADETEEPHPDFLDDEDLEDFGNCK